jgi:hypothetical protein
MLLFPVLFISANLPPVKNCITDNYNYEIISRYPIGGILTNINVELIKKGYAICKDVAMYQGENESNSTFHLKYVPPSNIEHQAQACIKSY